MGHGVNGEHYEGCPFRVEMWEGERRVGESLSPLSLDAARYVATCATAVTPWVGVVTCVLHEAIEPQMYMHGERLEEG